MRGERIPTRFERHTAIYGDRPPITLRYCKVILRGGLVPCGQPAGRDHFCPTHRRISAAQNLTPGTTTKERRFGDDDG